MRTGLANQKRTREDAGVTIILTALTLVVLMLFAAFAVDFGMLFNARRLDQNAADAAALAASQEDFEAPSDMLAQVDSIASRTLDVGLGTIDWTACSLADLDPVDTPIVVSGVAQTCITVDTGDRVQVKLPEREVTTVFSRVVGRNALSHSAFAIAGLQGLGFGDVLPFGIPSGSNESYECIKTGSSGHSEPPCDGAQDGNFGTLDFTWFGDPVRGTEQRCTGLENERLANNMAVGVDHDLKKFVGDPRGEVTEVGECGGAERDPNSMMGETGNKPGALGAGIYSETGFSDTGPARLKRTNANLFSGAAAAPKMIGSHALDDNPLWEFIDPLDEDGDGVVEVPPSCQKAVFTDVLGNNYSSLPVSPADVKAYIEPKPKAEQMRLLLDRCFAHYRGQSWNPGSPGPFAGDPDPTTCPNAGCTDPVFARNSSTTDPEDLYDIQYSPRFGYVPRLTSDFQPGVKLYHIESFRAIFMQRLLGGCNGLGICGLDFEPGVPIAGSSVPGDGSAEAMTAWVFPETMLPGGLSGEDAPFDIGKNRFVRLVR